MSQVLGRKVSREDHNHCLEDYTRVWLGEDCRRFLLEEGCRWFSLGEDYRKVLVEDRTQ